MTTNQTERVSDEELDQMIWKLERDGMTPKMLSLMREVREVRRAKGEPVAWSTKDVRNGSVYLFSDIDSVNSALSENQYLEIAPLYAATPAPVVSEVNPQVSEVKTLVSELPTDDERIMAIEGIAPPAPVVPDELADNIDSDDHPLLWSYNSGWNACRDAMQQANHRDLSQPVDLQIAEYEKIMQQAAPDCWCRACRPVTMTDMRFVVCPDCGNKRCPHANDHRNACTGSNEPGQEGSAYPAPPQEVK